MAVATTVRAEPPAPRVETRIAVVDVGSNTARLVLFAATPSGGIRPINEAKEVPRLGKGVGADGALSEAAIDRGLTALRRFGRLLEQWGRPRTIAVATSAVRDAPNAPDFLKKVESETGLALRVLSGEEEAHYAYVGAAGAFELGDDLVLDLGGGSLQLARTRAGKSADSVSLPLGALRLGQTFLEHDPPKERELEALREHVRDGLREVPGTRGVGIVYGIGGSVRSVARVAIAMREYPMPQVHGLALHRRDLKGIASILFEMPSEERRDVPGLSADRAEVILPGLVVLSELLEAVDKEEMIVCGTGIREGVVWEELGTALPAPTEELARRSVEAHALSLGFSLEHGAAVRELALDIFDRLNAAERRWSAVDRLSLSVAGWLHDSGTVIDLWRHERHSAYLVRQLPLFGIAHRERALASLIAWLHEGDEPPDTWRREWRAVLEPADLAKARELGTVLALAEALVGTEAELVLAKSKESFRLRRVNGTESDTAWRNVKKAVRSFERQFDVEVKTPFDR